AALRRLRAERQTTMVLVSHDMGEVAELAEHVLVLHQGRLALQGPPRELFNQTHVLAEWGLDVPGISHVRAILRQHDVLLPSTTLLLDELVEAILTAWQPSQETRGAQGNAG